MTRRSACSVVHRSRAAARVAAPIIAAAAARLAAPIMVAALALLASAPPATAGDLRPMQLQTESARNPLGIDAERPRLSWRLRSNERGARQTVYRILVATSPDRLSSGRADVWDSGRVMSSDSVGVEYAGPAVASRQRYFWKVRVWDGAGRPSPWSAQARWEMGLLARGDWSGEWIGGASGAIDALTFDGAHWMWFPEGDPTTALPPMTRYFRLRFDLPADRQVTRAQMLLTADDRFVLYANGERRGETAPGGLWYDGRLVDVTSSLHPGGNVVALAATNALDTNGNPSPAGVVGRIVVEFDSGEPLVIPTGGRWRAADEERPGWQEPGFDDSAWVAARETAVYGTGPWGRGVSMSEVPKPAPLLRREFTVDKPVRRARIYLAGLGYHELQLNGRRVSDHVLDPAPTDYDERVLYVVHDVTDLLQRGRNAVGAELGRGFFGLQTSTAWAWTEAPWNGDPRLLAQIEIEYADGTREVVASDDRWRTADGPTRSDSIYAGETYDARDERSGWSQRDFDDTGWTPAAEVAAPSGRLAAQRVQPIRVLESVDPVAVSEPKPGVHVFDMGRTLGGWASLRVSGPRGARIRLEYGQQLHGDGTVNLEQGYVHGGRFQRDEYVLRGDGVETWHPRFSHKSFRYVQVTGLPGPPVAGTVRGHEVRTAAAPAGRFSSSSELYDRIHGIVVRSTGHHMLGIPAVDVMYEKIGWTADAHLNIPSFANNFRSERFLAKWLDDLGDSQGANGVVPVIAPSGGWGYDWRAPEWTAAYPIAMWELYQRFGDRRALERHYDGVRRYVDWELSQLDGAGLATSTLGDWLAPGYTQPPEDKRLSATAYLHRSMRIAADAAAVLERTADAQRYEQQAAALSERFNATFLDRDRGIYRTATDGGYRQGPNALALAFGLVPDGFRARVADGLVADVRARGDHLNTGALGTAVLLPALSEAGHVEVAHAIAGQRTFPSWGYWLEHGADTLWETWELQHGGQGRPPSRDHYLFGSIDQWFFEQIAGITAAAPGYERIRIRPYVEGPLDHASAQLDTVRGQVAVRWHKRRKGGLELRVEVPANATADVHVPAPAGATVLEGRRPAAQAAGVKPLGGSVYRVGAGRYAFRVQPGPGGA